MSDPQQPRDELSAAEAAKVDRLYRAAPLLLRNAIAEGRVRQAGCEPFHAFDDLGFVQGEES